MEEHKRCMKRRCACALFFMRRHDCMVHRKTMSSFRLGNLGARPTPQSAQLAVKASLKESTMEEHQPKERERQYPWWQGATQVQLFSSIGFNQVLEFEW